MIPSPLPRRAVLGVVLATSLFGAGLAAFADGGIPAGCPPTYTDPAGDAALLDPATAPLTGDGDLDIVAVTHSVDGAMFTTGVKVKKLLATGPDLAFGDRFITAFTVGGKAVTVTAERDFSGLGDKRASATVGGTAVTFPVKVVEDLKGNTLNAVMAAADLEKAVGTRLAGLPFTAMSSTARAIYPTNASPATFQPGWDTATAPPTASYRFGAGCGRAATPPARPAPAPAGPAPAGPPPAAGANPQSDYPLAGCSTYSDPKGDASYNSTPNEPDLDITAVTMRTTADAFVTYIKLDKLAAKPAAFDGHRFYSEFVFNKHVFSIAASQFSSYGSSLRENASKSGQVGPMSVMSVDSQGIGGDPGFTDTKVTSTFDVKGSTVVLSVPLAAIEKFGKAPVAGATFSSVQARAGYDSGILIFVADTAKAAKPDEAIYRVGDNHCFAAAAAAAAPMAPPLRYVGAVQAQYGDQAAVAARLVNRAGAPVAGQRVTFTLGASRVAGTTAANGVARAALLVRDKAGRTPLTITSGSTTTKIYFTILVERTVLRATGDRGTVTATLTDDDGHPVGGQLVTFTAGARQVSARTDVHGVAKASGLPAGSVKVDYAGARDRYTAASTSTSA